MRSNFNYNQLVQKLHEYGISDTFDNCKQRSSEKLLDLLEISDLDDENKLSDLTNKFRKTFKVIKSMSSKVCDNGKKIYHWKKSDINKWLEELKKSPGYIDTIKQLVSGTEISILQENRDEIISVIWRGVELIKGHYPKYTQILALLLSIEFFEKNKTLMKINTGEGKTYIVAMISIFFSLYDLNVDIVTSSSVLAKRDCEENRELYSSFNLSTGHNCYSMNGKKDWYKNNIVYGNIGSFEGDYLTHYFKGKNTRGDREFEKSICIVDEVDNMLLDNSDHITMLSSDFHGFEPLSYFIRAVGSYLAQFMTKIVNVNKNFYYVENLAIKEVEENGFFVQKVDLD